MQFGVMITNGGAHPPEKWAVTTAEQIFPIGQDVAGDRLILAKKVQLAITEALLPHHDEHQADEKSALDEAGADHLDTEHDPIPRAEDALESVIACMTGTPWEDKTRDPEWRGAVGGILASHFATSADIERRWHCHRNPNCERSQAWLAARNGGAN